MAEVSIIILTYNSAPFIESLLNSLEKFSKDTEIIVVDNSSSDDTLKIAGKFDFVKTIDSGKNLGFSKGINLGSKNSKGEYLLFLNPDTHFEKGDISKMTDVFKKHEKVGIVGGRMMSHSGLPEKSAGKFFNLFETLLIIFGLDEKFGVRSSPEKESKVDFVSGGFMLVSAAVFMKLNGFDENFFMYVEDMELCYRARKEGYSTYFTPEIVVSHKGQGSSNRGFAIVNIYKGIAYFYKKHKNILEYYFIKMALCFKALSVYLVGLVTNNSYYKKTYKEALRSI